MGESSEHIEPDQKRKVSTSKKKKMTRRQFLRRSTAAAAGAAVLATGCEQKGDIIVRTEGTDPQSPEKPKEPVKKNKTIVIKAEPVVIGVKVGTAKKAVPTTEFLPTPTPEKPAISVPRPEYVKGDRKEYETYGHTEPLNQEQVDALIVHLNKEFKEGGVEMKDNTYYSTEFIRPAGYESIPKDTGRENYQAFMEAQDEAFNEILAPAGIEQVTRRIIVVKDGVEVTGTTTHINHIGTDKWVQDSDGHSGLWFHEPYNPTESAYYRDGVDRGRIHEKAHYVLHSHDLSRRNYAPEQHEEKPSCFDDIPQEHREYNQERRNDREATLMLGQHNSLSSYTKWLLGRREVQGYVHDLERTVPEYAGFPNEAAENNILVLGEEYDGADIEIWRSSGEKSPETFNQTSFDKKVENGEVNIGNPFENVPLNRFGTVSGGDSLLLIKARLTSGEVRFRYFDLGDLSIGLGLDNYPDNLKMKLNMANKNMKPEELDWKIWYEKVYE